MPRSSRPSFIPSPFKMSLTGDKLTDLPVPLQSFIISNLSQNSAKSKRIKINLEAVNTVTERLPSDLLPVAKSSRALSAATADALGTRAQALNRNTAKPLHEWVTALGSAVMAVSLYDSEIAREENWSTLKCKEQEFFDDLYTDYMKTFKSLSAEHISLKVLDVKAVQPYKCNVKEELLASLVGALEQSSTSLMELGLRITPLCAKAVAKVCLPRLEIAELELKEIEESDEILTSEEGKSAEAFMEILQALENHADRKQNKTTVRELRLFNVYEAPCVEDKEGCSGLFKSVKILKLRVLHYRKMHDDLMAKFISLFSNLECLHWDGSVTTNHLRVIHSGCANLKELHLHPPNRYEEYATPQTAPNANESKLGEMFIACEGKLKTMAIKGKLRAEQLKVLGENNAGLEHLVMEIDRENVNSLSLLLGSHCRKLRKLELFFEPGDKECFGVDGWRTFTESVKSASEELCEVSVEVDDPRISMELAVEAMVQSMVDIIEFLGERAREVILRVPMETGEERMIIKALCRIMRACMTHAKSLESLGACFVVHDYDYDYALEEEEKEVWEAFLKEKKKMMEELPHLKMVDFDGFDDTIEERLEEMED